MKNSICSLAFLLFILPGFGQKKTESVIVASGNTIVSDYGSMDWIVGANLIDHEVLFGNNSTETVYLLTKNDIYTVSPTLTKDKIYIKSSRSINENLLIKIFDLTGKLLLIKYWEENPTELDLQQYASGIYIIHLIDNENNSVAPFKVIKN